MMSQSSLKKDSNGSYSGKQVIKAGEKLISDDIFENQSEFEQAMDILSYWRFTHELPLEEAFKIVKEAALHVEKKRYFCKKIEEICLNCKQAETV